MMDSRDVSSNNHVFSSSSLATSNHIHDGLPLLLISVHERDNLHDQPDDVNNRPQALPFLSSNQRSIQPSYYYYNNNPAQEESGASPAESVTIVDTGSEIAFPVVVLTVSLVGIIAVGVLLFYWFKRNLTQQQQLSGKKHLNRALVPGVAAEPVLERKMSEHGDLPIELPLSNAAALSSVSSDEHCDTPQILASSDAVGENPPPQCRQESHPTADTIYKNVASDNLPMVASPHNLRRAQAKSSLNNISMLSTSCSPSSSPSPPMKSIGRKFSFNQSNFYEQQQQVSSIKNKNCANNSGGSVDTRGYTGKLGGSKADCLISKVAVLRGDVCCVQPPQYHAASVFESAGSVSPMPSSPKTFFNQGVASDQSAVAAEEHSSSLSDDKENLVKCMSPHETSRSLKNFRGYHHTSINTDGVDSPSNRKVLTQSPIFFTTSTTPNTLMNSYSSSSAASSTTTKGRFTFSPKVVNEYGHSQQDATTTPPNILNSANSHGKYGNSYFRFPEVDTFTPPPSSAAAQVSTMPSQLEVKQQQNVYKIPSLVTSCIPSLETPTKEEASDGTGKEGDLSIPPQSTDQRMLLLVDIDNESQQIGDDQFVVAPALFQQDNASVSLTNRASRRARLKSISLDSEGARLVEENLATSIPVEELVEIAASQTHYSSVATENQVMMQSFNQSQTMGDIGESSFSAACKKRRNIFNLTLNLNDKDETLTLDDDYKFNEFYFEYYDYDDEEDEEYDMELNAVGGTGSEKAHHRKQHHFSQLPTPKTPTLTQTRKKASSLDSDQSLSYLLPAPVRNHCPIMDKAGEHHASGRCTLMAATGSTTGISGSSSLRTSSLSVPTTPKRQPYRLQQHHVQQQHGKYKQISNYKGSEDADGVRFIGTKNSLSCMPQQRDPNLSVSNVNLKTLPEITSVCDFADKEHGSVGAVEKPPIQTLNKSRSSILQRRGSNHSLTLNLDAPSLTNIGLSKGLSASNYSLGNYKGSHLSLVSSSNNLQQQRQGSHQATSQVQSVQTKKNLLQRRGSNTSLVLNLQGSSNSLNRYNSHSSLNIQNQQNVRPVKRGLLERRNSNTSLTLINIQNRALSVSNCNLPGSNCSLNSMATYQTQNDVLMLEEDEHQLAVNNKQSSCCNRAMASTGTVNESHHLSPSCQQHGARRKFLSSDSLHNITSTRAGCCCQQKETNSLDNPQIGYTRNQMGNYSISITDVHHSQESQNIDCSCNAKLTTSVADKLSSNDMFKVKATVTSTASTNNLTQFTCCDCCCCNCADALSGGVNTMSISNTSVRKITTKPLSPQTTSEDFKIYLANIQFLQNASNMLSERYMKNLQFIFTKSYGNYDRSQDDNVLSGANNDVKLTNLAMVSATPSSEKPAANAKNPLNFPKDTASESLSDEEQKKMILKIHQEFWDLPTNYQEKPLVFGSQPKNRYKTILPNEHSRVILKAECGSSNEPYINANFIKGPDYTNNSYIATQGPMANTIYEFWLMVQQNVEKSSSENNGNSTHVSQKLIMLTDFVENNRQKCSVYFPREVNESLAFTGSISDDSDVVLSNKSTIIADAQNYTKTHVAKSADIIANFNYFLVTNVGICRKNGYTMRKLLVIYSYQDRQQAHEIRNAFTIYHYWFPDWPDHRSPEDIDVLLDMSLDILDNDCIKDFDPPLISEPAEGNRTFALPIIHCSAGIGRTGCLLAILNGLSQIRSSMNVAGAERESADKLAKSEQSPSELAHLTTQHPPAITNGQVGVDILGIVCNLRLQRGGMVQNSEQYELIHRALCLYMQKLSF